MTLKFITTGLGFFLIIAGLINDNWKMALIGTILVLY